MSYRYYRNSEGYSDPTAGEAIANIRRQERKEKRIALRKKQKNIRCKKTICKEAKDGRI